MSSPSVLTFGRVIDACTWDALHDWSKQYGRELQLSDVIAINARHLNVHANLRPGGRLQVTVDIEDRNRLRSLEHFSAWRRTGPHQWENVESSA